jgi:hypothetical protein
MTITNKKNQLIERNREMRQDKTSNHLLRPFFRTNIALIDNIAITTIDK